MKRSEGKKKKKQREREREERTWLKVRAANET